MIRLPLSIRLAPKRAHDALFMLACRLLLPIATDCKVCNMLRGMLIGFFLGLIVAAAIGVASLRYGWGY